MQRNNCHLTISFPGEVWGGKPSIFTHPVYQITTFSDTNYCFHWRENLRKYSVNITTQSQKQL